MTDPLIYHLEHVYGTELVCISAAMRKALGKAEVNILGQEKLLVNKLSMKSEL